MEIKTIYEVQIIDSYGLINYKSKLKINKFLILFLIIGIFILKILSNIIFEVEVIHNSSEIRNFILDELKNYNIDKYKIKKNYKEIQKIKEEILNKYKNKIEWIEIENKGTKYIIRIEIREIIDNKEEEKYRNIVAKKSAIIKKIIANKGEVVKSVNTYVNKGDVIISGEIKLNDEIKGYQKSDGIVYGEVWYEVKTEYPFHYKETKETGKTKTVYIINFLNKNIELTFNKFKNKKTENKEILKRFPFSLIKQNQKEIEIIDNVYTEDEVIELATNVAIDKINAMLDKDEYIIDKKILLINIKNSKIELDMFFSVYENITEYIDLKEE